MRDYDAIILGGGLVGCLTALHLDRLGLKCVLVEKKRLCEAASGSSAGGLYYQLPHQVGCYSPQQQKLVAHLVPLLLASQAAWQRMVQLFPGGMHANPGGMIVAINDEEQASLERKHAMEREFGLDVCFLNRKDLKDFACNYSDQVQAATFCPREGYWDPRDLRTRIALMMSRSGIDLLLNTNCQHVEKDGKFRVYTDTGLGLTAPIAVGALGADMAFLLNHWNIPHGICKLPLQMCSVQARETKLPYFTRYTGGRLSLKKLPQGTFYIGGGWSANSCQNQSGKSEISINVKHLIQNLNLATTIVPELRQARLENCWSEWVAWTSDGLPIVEASQQLPGLLLACGGNGFSLAPLYAEILADLAVKGQTSLPIAALSLERFTKLQAAPSVSDWQAPALSSSCLQQNSHIPIGMTLQEICHSPLLEYGEDIQPLYERFTLAPD